MRDGGLLVTGGAGFIGANFVHYYLGAYPDSRVIVLDALTYAGNRESLTLLDGHSGFQFVHGDINNGELLEKLIDKEEIKTIVHFAAESHVDRSIHGPDPFIETNVVGTHSLLKAAKKMWVDNNIPADQYRFHHVSTDEVYGSLEPGDDPFYETTPYDPSSPYAASKASSDHLVRAYHRTYGLNVTLSNCSNNYGPYHFPEKLIPLMIINGLMGKTLPVYGDGKNIRDWLYVEEHCRAIDIILKKGESGETYNVGGKCEVENIELVKTICAEIDKRFQTNRQLVERFPDSPAAIGNKCETLISYVEDRLGHDRRYAINLDKVQRDLGFELRESIQTGLEKTIDWYLDNEDWWRPLLDRKYEEWIKTQYEN